MILLIIFAFLAGIVTILSPCILPILPIILSSSIGTQQIGKARPLGVIVGFVLSFTIFTLFLSSIVRIFGIPAESLRVFSVVVIALFGLSMLIPKFQIWMEILFSKLSQFLPQSQNQTGFGGGIIMGLSLGLLWTPCVGPILASVISLAITGSVNLDAFFITLAYAIGTAIPMFFIMIAGQTALKKTPWLLANSGQIQKAFGVLMILTAIAIFFNFDRKFQTFILDTFPNYGVGLTKFEDIPLIQNALKNLSGGEVKKEDLGKPMFDLTQPKGNLAPELIPSGEWFNSQPLKLSDLRGKVVLIDFWTYSCINCQRTFPYLKSWWDKYQNKGLVIIGVHSPEFEFEKNPENVKKAIADFGLTYPIVQDNDFSTWRAYKNRFWPAKYFIDKEGNIRYTHFGEGAYDESEKVIQELLSETGSDLTGSTISNPEYENYAKTPELYLGYGRMQFLSSPEYLVKDAGAIYTSSIAPSANTFGFSGEWDVMEEYSNPKKGSILYLNFDAKEVFLVMRPKNPNTTSKVEIYLDGKPVSETDSAGIDVKESILTVKGASLYKLINLKTPGRHILKLEFLDPNTEIYAFTFG
ncbi:cytochrome c biogenesis protein DipZ [Candidatus Daviesbacteria bacterium]|nr:cytochrome c biogenesis protein DipZ [Candidatus Daviesbacteria bacterium]